MDNTKVQKIVIVLLSSVLLLESLFIASSAFQTPSTGPYYLSVPTGTWSYWIGQWDNGTYYSVNQSNWHIDCKSSNASAVINNARGNLTLNRQGKEIIKLVGNISLTAPILLDSYTAFDLRGATLNLAADVNMFQTANNNTICMVEIDGGILNGGNHTGTAIMIRTDTDLQPSWRNMFIGLTIEYFLGDGLHLEGTGGRTEVSECYIYYCTRGVYANSPDGKFVNVVVGNSRSQGWFVAGGSNTITGCKGYGSGQVTPANGYGIEIAGHNIQVIGGDFQENSHDGGKVDSTSYSATFVGCTFDRNGLSANNTYDGLRIDGDNITVTGGHGINMGGKDKYQRYGVYIASTCDSIIVSSFGFDNLVASTWYYVAAGATNIRIDVSSSPPVAGTIYEGEVLIEKDGANLVVRDGKGTMRESALLTDLSGVTTLVNDAFGYLTTSRTWKEKVVLDANVTVNNIVYVPSYTVFEVTGQLAWVGGLTYTGGYLRNKNAADQWIELCGGGTINANADVQAKNMSTIVFTSTNDVSVHDLTIYGGQRNYGGGGVDGEGLKLDTCLRGIISNCHFIRTTQTYDCVKIYSTNETIVSGNTQKGVNGGFSSFCQIYDGYYNLVEGNEIHIYDSSSQQSGLKIHDGHDNVLRGNIIWNDGSNMYGGIDLIQDADYNVIDSNTLYNVEVGIRLRETTPTRDGNVISGNKIWLQSIANAYGIRIIQSNNCTIINNFIWGTSSGSDTGIYLEDATVKSTFIENNYYSSNLNTWLTDNGLYTVNSNNYQIP
jgi:hypothetical protein